MILIYVSLINNEVEHLYTGSFLTTCVSSLENHLIRCIANFRIQLFVILLSSKCPLYIFDASPLPDT
jgi:hypothetical protein